MHDKFKHAYRIPFDDPRVSQLVEERITQMLNEALGMLVQSDKPEERASAEKILEMAWRDGKAIKRVWKDGTISYTTGTMRLKDRNQERG